MGGAGILHQFSCIGGSRMVAITGKEVVKGGELLVQVPTQAVEFALDGSNGGLLLGCCGAPRVLERSKMWVTTLTPDVVNCSEGMSSLLFVDSLGMVNFLQQGPGLLQFLGSVHVGSRAQAKRSAGLGMGANLTTGPFGTLEFEWKGRLYTGSMNCVPQVRRARRCGLWSEWCGW